MYARTGQVAAGLRRAGVGRGDHVLVFVPMSVDLYVTLLGTLQAGAVAVFVSTPVQAAKVANYHFPQHPGLEHVAIDERVSSGVPRLDTMLGGKGYFGGSSVLVSGTPGCGKTSLAAHFVNAGCARGVRRVPRATRHARRRAA